MFKKSTNIKVIYITAVIISLFSIIPGGFAQSVRFNKTYDFNTDYVVKLNSIVEINNNYFINGMIYKPNLKTFLMKVNITGVLQDTLVLGKDTGNNIVKNSVVINDNKILILSGNEHTNYEVNPHLFIIDTNMNIIVDSLFFFTQIAFYDGVRFNNKLYFTGFTKYDSLWNMDSNNNLLYWRTDTNLYLEVYNSIGTLNIYDGGNIINFGFDNNLLIGGRSRFNGDADWYLINTDTSGNVLGHYFYGHPTLDEIDGITGIITNIDSTYCIAGLKAAFEPIPFGYLYNYHNIIKLNRSFEVLWEKQYEIARTGHTLNKIKNTHDLGLIVLGQSGYREYCNPLTFSFFSFIYKLDIDGRPLWRRYYFNGDTCSNVSYRLHDIIEASDSGFVMCGTAYDTVNIGSYTQAWLVKTDSIGCDGLRSCNDTAMVVQILNFPDTLCKDSTSHIALRFKGRSAPYSLYANSTLALDSIYYPYTLPLWIDTIMPFVPQDTGWQNLIVTLHEPWERTASDTVQVYVRNCTTSSALQEFYKQDVEIFPNPATSELHVKIRGQINETYTITIHETQGKTVDIITTKEKETVIDISKYRQGVYWVRVLGNNIVRSEKVIILKND